MFAIKDEGALPSLADIVERHDLGGSPSDTALEQFRGAVASEALPVAPTMGFTSDLRDLVDRIVFRKLVRVEPDLVSTLPWFDCHVPPGGKTTMRANTTTKTDASGELLIYGSGIGAGRKVSLSLSSESAPRLTCATYGVQCKVRPRIYAVRGKESVELEVVECLGESIVSHDVCPFCGVAPAAVDVFDFSFGDQLDLRRDNVVAKRKFQLTFEKSFSATAKFKVPTLAPELKLGATMSRSMTLEVEQEFPPGALYRGYSRLGDAVLQTPMWAIERTA